MSLAEKLKRFRRDLPPGALGSIKQAMMQQMISVMGSKVLDWVMAKPGRRFVFENGADGEEGIAFYFEEAGEKVTPDFMGGSGA